MQFQRVNRTDPEKAFGICKNVSGGSLSGNYPVVFCIGTGSNDGISVTAPVANNGALAGILDVDVGDTEYGLYQAHGFRNSVRIYAHGTSVSISAGYAMGPPGGSATSNGVSSTGALTAPFGPLIAMELIGAAVTSPGGYGKAFLRCL